MPLFVLCSVIYAVQYSAVHGINSTFWRFKSNDLLIVLQKTVSKQIFLLYRLVLLYSFRTELLFLFHKKCAYCFGFGKYFVTFT